MNKKEAFCTYTNTLFNLFEQTVVMMSKGKKTIKVKDLLEALAIIQYKYKIKAEEEIKKFENNEKAV